MNTATDPHPLPPPDVVGVGMQVSYWAERFGDLAAVIDDDQALTYAELNAHANRLVRSLRSLGAEVGDVIGVMSRNCAGWAVVMAAVERGGFCFVPINWHLTSDEVGYIAEDSGCRYLFHDAESTAVAAEVAARCGLRATWCLDRGPDSSTSDLDRLIDGHDGSDIADPVFGTRMAYTSGTTGHPKAVERTPEEQRRRAMELAATGSHGVKVHYTPGVHRHLATGPLYHSGPGYQSLVVPLHAAATVVMMRSWDSERFLRLIEQHRITHTHVAPIMFHRLLSLPDDVRARYDVSSMVQLRHGGSACPVAAKHAMIEWFGPVLDEYYGATEGAATNVDSVEWLKRPGTVGRVDPPGTIVVVGDDGEELAPGEIGTIYILAKHRFRYRGDSSKTEAAYRGDHFTVGDVGYLDDDGYLFLTDRSIDLVVSGGVNIYPAEIEQVLAQHPAVRDVAVVGVPNPEWGEELWAAVLLEDSTADTARVERELRELSNSRLARFKCPRRFLFEPELPREDSGKLFKRRLRDRYRELATG